MYLGRIRSVRVISRDDRARIATCSLRTPTDRFKANYSVDIYIFHAFYRAGVVKNYEEFWMNVESPILIADVPSEDTEFLSEVKYNCKLIQSVVDMM